MAHVYFLIMSDPSDDKRDFGLVKVGMTDGDVVDRIAQLQTGNPYELRCVHIIETPYARELEHFVHRTHAEKMQHLEWLRWPRDRLALLVDEAKEAGRRIDARKSRETEIIACLSNGNERRPDRDELLFHRQARELHRQLVPAALRLTIVAATLKARTGMTCGIDGILRVHMVPCTERFSANAARTRFPELAARCCSDGISGRFAWRKVPRPVDFLDEKLAAEDAERKAEVSAAAVLRAGAELVGSSPRTADIERLHEAYLRETQIVSRLRADLADLQTELTIRLGADEAIHRVCSFKRESRASLDAVEFCKNYPTETRQCMEPVPPQLRKYIYPTRSYL